MINVLDRVTGAEYNPQYDTRGLVRGLIATIAEAHGGNPQALDFVTGVAREFGVRPEDLYEAAAAMTRAIGLLFGAAEHDFERAMTESGYTRLPETTQAAFERCLGRKCVFDAHNAWRGSTPILLAHPRGFDPGPAADVLKRGAF